MPLGFLLFYIFTNAEAAANTYNRVAAYRGYPDRFLNDVPYMTKRECDAYRDLYYLKNRKTMVYVLEKVRHKTLTDKSEFKIMCKIIDKDKQRDYSLCIIFCLNRLICGTIE